MIGKRATMAANKINEQRGWVQSMAKREWNIDEITNACIEALKEMDSFDFNTYEAKLKAKGYGVNVMRDSIGKVRGYSLKKGNSTYKSTLLGHKRSLTPSRLRASEEATTYNPSFRICYSKSYAAEATVIAQTDAVASHNFRVSETAACHGSPRHRMERQELCC